MGDRGRQNGHVFKIYLRLKLFLLFSLYSRYVGDNDETGDVTLKRVPNIGGLSEEDVQLCKEQIQSSAPLPTYSHKQHR